MASNEDDELFVEIHPEAMDVTSNLPDYVEAYVAEVQPQACGPLIKHLSSQLRLSSAGVDLSHLKRVKNSTTGDVVQKGATEDSKDKNESSPQKKRQKRANSKLLVLIGSSEAVKERYSSERTDNESLSHVLERIFQVDNVKLMSVPGRPPESEEKWKEFLSVWPTNFFPNKSVEFRMAEQQLTADFR